MEQASDAAQRATEIKNRWAPAIELQPLQPADGNVVTLDQALDLALSNNRSLRADLEVIAQAKADLVQAGLLSNPVLSFAGMLPEGGGRADLTFGLSKDFADLWLIPTRKRAAQAVLQQRVLVVADVAVALVNDVRANYYTLQYQSQAIDLQEQNLRVLRDVIELTQARLKAGEASQLDLYLTRGRLLETELELLQLRAEFELTRQALLRLMGVADASMAWRPAAPDAQSSVLAADEVAILDAALRQRLDVQAADWDVQAALADVQQQRLRVIPSLNIGVSGDRFERRALPGRKILADTARASGAAGALTAPEIQSRGQRNLERRQIIDLVLGPMIEVPLPIFDQNLAQIAKAQSRARELLQRYEEVEQRVIQGVRSAMTRRRLAEDRVRLFQESLLPVQQASLELARKAYQAGRESILAVLLAQEALIRTRLNYTASTRDLAISTAALERELSGRIPDSLLRPLTTQPAATQRTDAGQQTRPSTQPASPGG
ncbi:MAG: TolC family protein [Phycisphaerae bacterium]|nr:TolC family protein [Phycisphaerae bacterium]